MSDPVPSLIERVREWDDRRPSLPGEHWITAAIGIYLLLRRGRSTAGRLVSAGAGALLVMRALTGRDGAMAALERLASEESDGPDYIDVAAPWPYDRRVRITAPRRARPNSEPAPQLEDHAPVV